MAELASAGSGRREHGLVAARVLVEPGRARQGDDRRRPGTWWLGQGRGHPGPPSRPGIAWPVGGPATDCQWVSASGRPPRADYPRRRRRRHHRLVGGPEVGPGTTTSTAQRREAAAATAPEGECCLGCHRAPTSATGREADRRSPVPLPSREDQPSWRSRVRLPGADLERNSALDCSRARTATRSSPITSTTWRRARSSPLIRVARSSQRTARASGRPDQIADEGPLGCLLRPAGGCRRRQSSGC